MKKMNDMKTEKLCQYCKPIATLVLWVCVSLWSSASAAVIASTDFSPYVNSGDSVPWDLNSVVQEGVSGNHLSTTAEYDPDAANYRKTTAHRDFIYSVVNNPSILNSTYLDEDDPMLVIQYGGAMEPMTPFLTYDVSGLKTGTKFNITVEYYVLNSKLTVGTPLSFKFSIDPNGYGASDYDTDLGNAASPQVSTPQVKQTLKLSGTVLKRDMNLAFLFPYSGKEEGYAIGITKITLEGTLDPVARSSQGSEACKGEQTLLFLDKEYNASTYSWQRYDHGTWKEVGNKKSLLYEMQEDETFRCLVDGAPSNELEVKSIMCCEQNGKPASRRTLMWETFGRFTGDHTYLDRDGNSTTTPVAWPKYWADVSYDLPGHIFDDGKTQCTDCKSGKTPGKVDDGYYAIVVPTPNGYALPDGNYANWMKGVHNDHTSVITGESNSAALAINVDFFYTGPVFEAEFPDICTGKTIFYEAWFANLSAGRTSYPPIITVRVVDSKDGTVLHEQADVQASMNGGWERVNGQFELSGSGTRSVKLEVLSTNGSGTTSDQSYWQSGNDLILDDIKFMVCSPPSLEAYSDISTFAKDSTICSDMEFMIDAPESEMLKNFFGVNRRFLFQYSGDMGNTWRNISGLESVNEFTINTKDYTEDKMQFRVVVATSDVLDEFVNDPNKADIDDACRNYSITEPFTITRAGDLDLGATATTSACVDAAVTLVAPSLPSEVVAWGWTSEAGATVVPLSDNSDALSYEISHKSNDKEVYYFIAQTSDGCQGKRKNEVDVKPTVDFDYDFDELCEKTVFQAKDKTPSDAKIIWIYDGNDYEGDEFVYDRSLLPAGEDPTQQKKIFFYGEANGYCPTDERVRNIILKPNPGEPTITNPSLSFVMDAGNKASVLGAATADVDHTLQWVPTLESTSSAPTTGWSGDEPFVSLDYDTTYFFFVRQVNEYGCEGPAVKVHVTVSSSPVPLVRDTIVCMGDPVDMDDLVSTTDAIYELKWYDQEKKPDGSGDNAKPTVVTDVPGEYKFYVTQQSKQAPYPESKMMTVNVTVVGVYEPDTAGNTYHYCKGDQALPLVAKEHKDESKSFYANAMNWSVDGGTESTTVPTVDTDVTTTTSHEYTVYQSYKINNKAQEVCKGDPVKWKVEVTFVPALTTSQVTYMKADADEQGNFSQNLMERSGNAAIVNYTNSLKLWWYENDCVTKVGDGRTAPTPKVDPSVPAGMDDDSQSFCVKQEVDGCISEGTIVPILISDAPKPYVTSYVYCRGDVSEKLTTKPDQSFKPNAQYVLKWYGNGDKGDMTDLGITGDEGPAPTTNMRSGDNGKSEFYYYVTQTEMVNGVEGAESNPTEIKVTIYDKTEIAIDQSKLATVCKPQTIDIKPSVSFTNEVAGLSYDTRYYTDETLGEELGSTKVAETGDYHVQTRFEVTAMANSAVCVSDSVKIPVKIDTLQVLVENVGSCPDESTEFRVIANTNATDVKYTWNGITESDANGGTSTNDVFKTRVFTGANYGDVFFYSLQVNAGTCEFKADTMKVTLGEGPVTGTMTVKEDENSFEPNTFTDTKTNEFYSCGGALTITADYHDKDGNAITKYEWFDGSQKVGEDAVLTLPEVIKSSDKTYRVEFTNGCKTSVTISIHYRPIKVTPLSTKLTKLCEKEEFSAEVKTDFADSEHPEFTWFRNGEEVVLGGGTSLNVSRTKLTIDKVQTKDSGRYTFLMTNRGCEARAVLDSLVAMPYIVATKKIDTIVQRHSNPQIKLDVTVPAGGLDAEGNEIKYDWNGNRGEHETTNPLTLNDVTSDHYYEVTMSGADLCEAVAIVDVKVDAQLTLKTSLKDTICTGLSAVLVIDTTGTGKFRHEWPHPLTVTMETPGQQPVTLTPTQDGSLLKLTVSPTEPTVYKVRFSYGFEGDPLYQDTLATEPLYVIPAIGVTIPDAVTICEGEATDIVITDIQPEGTVIKWDADTTILTETLDTSAVTVKPVYMSGTNHEYMYGYNFVAYNPACNSSVPYTAYVNVDEPLEGEILGEKVICETFSSHLDASNYAATTYVWTLEGDTVNQGASMTVKPEKTAHYYLSMGRGACHKDDDFLLTVKTNPVIVDMDSVDIRVREVILKDGAGEEPFNFWVDDLSDSKTIDPVLYNLQFSKHTAHVVDKNGCVAQYLFEVLAPALTIPPYFTPNADGIHDGWLVPELPIVYPNAVVKIYDRFGKLLAEYLGSKEDGWDGTYNGHPMPSTDYWYVIDVEEIDRQFMGHFTLLRQ